ncbi:hypothetical protein JB92DRAFT_2829627 [Gautieria morchelliformis]|nr:hypothetical protein JB92DRAFT_2829627 [Gautieria morchelliformis]
MVVTRFLPTVSTGLSPLSLGLPALCDLALMAAPTTGLPPRTKYAFPNENENAIVFDFDFGRTLTEEGSGWRFFKWWWWRGYRSPPLPNMPQPSTYLLPPPYTYAYAHTYSPPLSSARPSSPSPSPSPAPHPSPPASTPRPTPANPASESDSALLAPRENTRPDVEADEDEEIATEEEEEGVSEGGGGEEDEYAHFDAGGAAHPSANALLGASTWGRLGACPGVQGVQGVQAAAERGCEHGAAGET